ncbi:MAG: hypothetical protein ABJG41_14895 [Cyclobacteriaceae bacterium]
MERVIQDILIVSALGAKEQEEKIFMIKTRPTMIETIKLMFMGIEYVAIVADPDLSPEKIVPIALYS